MRLYSVRLLVDDFDACFRFYRDVVGLKPVWGEEGGPYADFDAGNGALLALFKRDLMAVAVSTQDLPSSVPAQDRAAIVLQVDDLAVTVSDLRTKGVAFVTEPKNYPAWTIRAAHFRDPAGNLIELFTPLREDQWTQKAREVGHRALA